MLSKKTKKIVAATMVAAVSNSYVASAESLSVTKLIDTNNEVNIEKHQSEDEEISEYDSSEYVNDITTGSAVQTTGGQVEAGQSDFEFYESTGTITKYIGNEKNVTVPSQINGVAVKEISYSAFEGEYDNDSKEYVSNIETIIIENGIETIGEYAFQNCVNLESIEIPESVTYIGHDALTNCSSLKSINVNENNKNYKSIDGVLFGKTDDTNDAESFNRLIKYPDLKRGSEYSIPDNITEIDDFAFENCIKIKRLVFPESIVRIEGNSIGIWNGLEEYYVPNDRVRNLVFGLGHIKNNQILIGQPGNAEEDSKSDFIYYIKNLGREFDENGDCTIIRGIVIDGYSGNKADIEIPDEIEGIEVIGVVIESVSEYGENKVESIKIPETVKDVRCYNTRNLKKIVVDKSNSNYSSIDGVLFDKNGTTLIHYPSGKEDETYTVPEGTIEISRRAFSNCKNLKELNVSKNVKDIENAFAMSCQNLESINVDEENEHYLSEDGILFNKNKDILIKYPAKKEDADYNIPEGVIEIGAYAFRGNNNLVNITLHKDVSDVGYSAFAGCDKLENIHVDDSNEYFKDMDGVLIDSEEKTLIQCPNGKINNTYKIPENIEVLGAGCFSDSDNLISIVIPENVTTIGDNAFSDCFNLKNVTMSDSVTWIGYYAFNYCENLESINLSKSINAVYDGMFEGCYKLRSIVIPEGVTSLYSYLFDYCEDLKSIALPSTVKYIDSEAFAYIPESTKIYAATEEVKKLINIMIVMIIC